MEANEAPEKIYLYPSRLEKGKIIGRWFMTRYNQDSVEYIRTDAFVDKACEWLEECIQLDLDENCELEWAVPFENQEEMITDFKKYMEDKQ